MKNIIYTLFFFCALASAAQNSAYVSANSLNLREQANTSSKVVYKLAQYHNMAVLDTITTNWLKVSYGQQTGYVYQQYVKKGKAKVYTTTGGRIGAVCKDGTRSSATGRGACSHHGGVSRWIYSEIKKVEIIDE